MDAPSKLRLPPDLASYDDFMSANSDSESTTPRVQRVNSARESMYLARLSSVSRASSPKANLKSSRKRSGSVGDNHLTRTASVKSRAKRSNTAFEMSSGTDTSLLVPARARHAEITKTLSSLKTQ